MDHLRRLHGCERLLDCGANSPKASNESQNNEGLDETLTVIGLNLPPSLTRSLSTTNPIENMNGRIRATTRRVKRWDGGSMILRWVLVGVLEAARGFRRLKGHKDMKLFVARLNQHGESAAVHPAAVDAKRAAA